MTSLRCLAVALTATAAVPAVATVPVSGDPVLYWNEVLLTGLAGSPTVQSRGYAMVEVALHDAVNATVGRPNRAYLGVTDTPGGDTRAAASKAARDVLVALNPAKTAEFDAALGASLALIPDGIAKTNGLATGATIAAAAIANRNGDGSTVVKSYTPSGLIGRWAPTPPAFAPASLPQWAEVNPWLIATPSSFRAAPPPALTSAAYAAAYAEVVEIGAIGSLTRTADQTAAAQFWAQGAAQGAGAWVRAAIDVGAPKNLSSLDYAAMLAQLATANADVVIATWDSKYYYDFWRPVTGVRMGDLDGNAATIGDATWTPLIGAPPHPSYVGAHSAVAASASAILESWLGNSDSYCLTVIASTRCFANFGAAAQDASDSRIWGGFHWRFDNDAGWQLGEDVAAFTLRGNFFDAVPEPATWSLMITGFGFIGAMGRRQTRRVSVA